MASEIKTVRVDKVQADRRAQPRVQLDDFLVQDYAEEMRAGAAFPPVVVFQDEEGFWLADGFHRHEAAKQAGKPTIRAEVRKGGLREAILHSVGANEEHGARRTVADKSKAVHTLLDDEEWSQWSDRVIAQKARVSNTFVGKIRAKLVASVNVDRCDGGKRLVERGGKRYTMNLPRVGDTCRLAPEALKLLRDTNVADDRRQVARLNSHPVEIQVEAAQLIESGEARNVEHALKQIRYDSKVEVAWDEAVQGLHPVWYADPPWHHECGEGLRGTAQGQYPTMPTDEICAMPVAKHLTEDAVLLLWTTNPHVPDALRVIDAWGFEYRTNICWVKGDNPEAPQQGNGFYVLSCHELLLIAVRGSLLPRAANKSLIVAARGPHSTKPLEVYDLIERMYPGMPSYVELFARRPPDRERWVVFGNEPGLTAAPEGQREEKP